MWKVIWQLVIKVHRTLSTGEAPGKALSHVLSTIEASKKALLRHFFQTWGNTRVNSLMGHIDAFVAHVQNKELSWLMGSFLNNSPVTFCVLSWLAGIWVSFLFFVSWCLYFLCISLSLDSLSLLVAERGSAVLGEDVGNSWAPSLLIVGLGET